MDYDEIKETSKEALENPLPGDYWNEMFCPVCVVIRVIGNQILFCKTKENLPDDKWTWDLDKLELLTLEEWRSWLSYDHRVGTWAHVLGRQSHLWAAEIVNERSS